MLSRLLLGCLHAGRLRGQIHHRLRKERDGGVDLGEARVSCVVAPLPERSVGRERQSAQRRHRLAARSLEERQRRLALRRRHGAHAGRYGRRLGRSALSL